ncbi:hypothetical protein V8E51_014642 [Hyaloscypha variabilis]
MNTPKSKYNELEFVNVTNPLTRKEAGDGKTVRKNVMLRSWHDRKQGAKGLARAERRQLLPRKSGKEVACRHKAAEVLLATIGNPQDMLGGRVRDPFASYPIPAAPYVDVLLRKWIINFSGVFCTIESATKASNPIFDIFLPLFISDAALFHAVLCFSSSLVDTSNGLKTAGPTTLVHMNSAIKLVSEALNNREQALSDKLLATICMITASHIIFKDYAGLERHLKGIDQIIELRGGIDSLRTSPLVYRLILWGDQFRGLHMNALPRYRPKSKVPYGPQKPPLITTSSAPENWSTRGVLSVEFISLMSQISELEQLVESCRGATVSRSTIRYFYHQRESIEDILIERIAVTSSLPGGEYESCCYLAASINSTVILRPFPPTSGVQSTLLGKLKIALRKTDLESRWGDDIELLLWVLVTAAHFPDPLHQWFIDVLKKVTGTLVPRPSLNGFKQILRRFQWNEKTSCPACERIYSEISGKMSSESRDKVHGDQK